jgi:SAM-dependent methyltransferase
LKDDKLSYTGLDILEALEGARNYNRLLTDLIAHGAGSAKSILDFGAGIGTFAKLLRARGYSVTCVEPDRGLADRLFAEGFDTYTGLAEIPDRSFPFAFSLNVLEHIEDDVSVLGALAGKLVSGGKILVYVPAFQALWTSLDDKVQHHRRYTKRTLRELGLSQGLEVLTLAYADSLGFLAALIFKWFGNREGRLSPASIRAYDRFSLPASRVLDHLLHPLLGKNVWALFRKP